MKRLLNCNASDFEAMTAQELKEAIRASEGRTVLVEAIVTGDPLVPGASSPEIAAAFGADMVLLNLFDTLAPAITGLPESAENPVACVKRLTGRPVGINLEPVDPGAAMMEEATAISEGRTATAATLARAEALGADYVCLTGNPGTGVSNRAILHTVGVAKNTFSGLVIAGKMHSSGVGEAAIDLEQVGALAEAGADIVLLPAPGTVPGVREQDVWEAVRLLHSKGALALAAIGTSQEGADIDTIRRIALASKRAGVDIHHLGDSGVGFIADPEAIMALSIAIRGKRHTYARMARSIRR